VTGWSADYILRHLPVAAGLQIILWHDLKAGRGMRWSVAMDSSSRSRVDIAKAIRRTLSKVESDSLDDA
jgi:hypothetical protein